MLRSPGERGERGLAILLENLKLPAAVGMKIRDISQSLRGGSENNTYQQQGSRILAKGAS